MVIIILTTCRIDFPICRASITLIRSARDNPRRVFGTDVDVSLKRDCWTASAIMILVMVPFEPNSWRNDTQTATTIVVTWNCWVRTGSQAIVTAQQHSERGGSEWGKPKRRSTARRVEGVFIIASGPITIEGDAVIVGPYNNTSQGRWTEIQLRPSKTRPHFLPHFKVDKEQFWI